MSDRLKQKFLAENNENSEVVKIKGLNTFMLTICSNKVLEGSDHVKQFLTYSKFVRSHNLRILKITVY